MKRNILVLAFIAVSLLFAACSWVGKDSNYGDWSFTPGKATHFQGDIYMEPGRIYLKTVYGKLYLFKMKKFVYISVNRVGIIGKCFWYAGAKGVWADIYVTVTPTGNRLAVVTDSNVFDKCIKH